MDIRQQRNERPKIECLITRLGLLPTRDADEIFAIRSLWRSAEHHRINQPIDAGQSAKLITSGWAGWVRHLAGDRRVVFMFLMPGDFIIPSIAGGEQGGEVVALTPVRTVEAAALAGLDAGGRPLAPKARDLLDRSGSDYRLRLIDHMASLMGGNCTTSLAELILELRGRVIATDPTLEDRFHLPVGQRILAEALGVSAVQINKILGRLRQMGIVTFDRGWLQIESINGLRELADPHRRPIRHERPLTAAGHPIHLRQMM